MYVASPPPLDQILASLPAERATKVVQSIATVGSAGLKEYIHWDKLRHLEPPGGLTHEEWWWSLKIVRAPLLRPLPLADSEGKRFSYAMSDEVLRLLHHVDQHCAGEIAMPRVVVADDQARQHYLVNSLMEEAIRSSQLEGATTSRRVAKELLRTGRTPADRSERMILNNYRALQFMREEIGPVLTPELVLELHRILTDQTLDSPDGAGRLQLPDDERVGVYDMVDGSLVHRPPPADQLPRRLEALCAFANGTDESERFMHPVVRAILVHLWLAYDHPFEDGNGRTARALFSWSMKQQGYRLIDYLSISAILRKAPAQYSRSFLLTESDDLDATYFLIYQLGVIARAIDELHAYLERKVAEVEGVERIATHGQLNHRQLALLTDAVKGTGQAYTYASHAASHAVTHETARTDLAGLEKLGLLVRRRMGRRHVFFAPPDLYERLEATGDST